MSTYSRPKALRALVVLAAVALVVGACLAIAGVAMMLRSANTEDTSSMAAILRDTDIDTHISLPWQPSLDEQYPPSWECAKCHPDQAAEWRASVHARSATNPLVHASVCGRCHTPLGNQFDELYQLKLYDHTPIQNAPAAAAEGVTCVTCHTHAHEPEEQVLTFISSWPNWLSTDLALEMEPFEEALGPFGTGAAGDPPPVENESHPSVPDPKLTSSELCRPCHEVVIDKAPLAPHCGLSQPRIALLTTYSEWAESPYAESDDGGETCQSCHMEQHEKDGPAAIAPPGTHYDQPLPDRPLRSHTVLGLSTEYLESGPLVDQQEERAADLVKDAAHMQLYVPPKVSPGSPLDVTVAITNTGAGHDLPTGFAFWSEAWLEIVIEDADGNVMLTSGDVDDVGWLRDEFNPRVIDGTLSYDPFLLSLRARLVSVGPNRFPWLQPDGTIRIPYDQVPRNLNGTPIIGPDAEVAAKIVRELFPDEPAPEAALALREGYILRFADTVVRNGIPAKQVRRARYQALVDEDVTGPIRVSARLLIRALWPWMLQQQSELPNPRPQPRIYEIATAEASIPLDQH